MLLSVGSGDDSDCQKNRCALLLTTGVDLSRHSRRELYSRKEVIALFLVLAQQYYSLTTASMLGLLSSLTA